MLRECSSECPSRLDDSPSGIACGPRRIRKASLSVGVPHVPTLNLGDECIRRSDEIWLNHLAVARLQNFQSTREVLSGREVFGPVRPTRIRHPEPGVEGF